MAPDSQFEKLEQVQAIAVEGKGAEFRASEALIRPAASGFAVPAPRLNPSTDRAPMPPSRG
jgi:hypothetical protein